MTVFRRVVQRIGLHTGRRQNFIPKLRVNRSAAPTFSTAWFICPDHPQPSGGVRKIYRCVDILNDAGFNAAVLHTRSGFRCEWFENTTRVTGASEIALGLHDLIVVPEIYGQMIRQLPENIRQVIFNQNAYNTVRCLSRNPADATPYTDNSDLALVLVVSEDNAKVITQLFPTVPVRRLHLGMDPFLFYPPKGPKRRRISYIPRKRRTDAAGVLALLRLRGVLDGWEVVAIEHRSEAETAELLRTSQLFLSFSADEGFGLPPLEALACGCLVVGYSGFGGREYFKPPFATVVENGDIAGFARAVEEILHRIDSDSGSIDATMAAAAEYVLQSYPLETERRDLLEVFTPLLGM